MSTDQNIQERAKEYCTHIGASITGQAYSAYIKGATEERELMSNHKEAAEATISRLYDATPDNKAELIMLFNLGAEYGRDMSNQWVSVGGDELPPMDVKTQIILENGEQYLGYYEGASNIGKDMWFCDNNDYHYPTHWQPLPSPPVIKKG
jgi:hypothetical protein